MNSSLDSNKLWNKHCNNESIIMEEVKQLA